MSLEITDRVRGTQTLGPDDLAARRSVLARIAAVTARYDFPAHEFPLLEHLDVYMRHMREEFRDRLFLLEDRAGRPLCLPPSPLAAAVRLHDARKGRHAQPLRLAYESPAFRYETIRRGNLRQFTLAGVEHLRPRDPLAAAAETAAWAVDAARAAGVSGARLVLSDVGVLRATVEGMDLPRAARAILLRHLMTPSAKIARYLPGTGEEAARLPDGARAAIERLTDDELVDLTLALAGSEEAFPGRDAREVAGRLVRKLRRGGDCGTYLAAIDGLAAVQGIAGNLREALDRIDSQPGGSPARDARVAALRTFGAYLTAYGIAEGDVFADFGMIRPYAVYDGIVHELHHDAAGPGKAIGGGGQYDAGWVLASPDRPAEALPGCGFAFGVERLLLAAEAEGTLVAASRSPADCLVTTAGNTPPGEAMALARILRAAGLAVRLDLPARSLKKELSDAAAAGIGFVAICGEKERAEGRVTVRAMASREEAGVPAGEVAAWIAARSGR